MRTSLFNLVAVFSVPYLKCSLLQMVELLEAAGIMAAAVVYNESEEEVVFVGDIHGTRVPGIGDRLQEVAGPDSKPVSFSLTAIEKEEPGYAEHNNQSRSLLLSIASC